MRCATVAERLRAEPGAFEGIFFVCFDRPATEVFAAAVEAVADGSSLPDSLA